MTNTVLCLIIIAFALILVYLVIRISNMNPVLKYTYSRYKLVQPDIAKLEERIRIVDEALRESLKESVGRLQLRIEKESDEARRADTRLFEEIAAKEVAAQAELTAQLATMSKLIEASCSTLRADHEMFHVKHQELESQLTNVRAEIEELRTRLFRGEITLVARIQDGSKCCT